MDINDNWDADGETESNNNDSEAIKLSKEDLKVLRKSYDKNGDGILSEEEIQSLIDDYRNGRPMSDEVKIVLAKYDTNHDGIIDIDEFEQLKSEININNTNARFAGYAAGLGRAFRIMNPNLRPEKFLSLYVGEALRPLLATYVVNASYVVAITYCVTDLGWEAYKLKERGYRTEHNQPMTTAQCVVERAAFQLIASMIVPTVVIHMSVSQSKKLFTRIGKFQSWAPSLIGLGVIPLLPLYVDGAVERGLDYLFDNFGPASWRPKKGKQS